MEENNADMLYVCLEGLVYHHYVMYLPTTMKHVIWIKDIDTADDPNNLVSDLFTTLNSKHTVALLGIEDVEGLLFVDKVYRKTVLMKEKNHILYSDWIRIECN